MSKIKLLFQGLVENIDHDKAINDLLSLEDIDNVLITVAFITESGIKRISDSLKQNSKKAKLFIGVNNDISTFQAVISLLNHGIHPYAVDTASAKVFHPKIYASFNSEKAFVIIGSSNLTSGGLNSNIEASSYIEFNRKDNDFLEELIRVTDNLIKNNPEHVFQITSEHQAKELLEEGRLVDARQKNREEKAKRKNQKQKLKPMTTYQNRKPRDIPDVKVGKLMGHWEGYKEYLAHNTKSGISLYWSVAKKNNDMDIHLGVLESLYSNQTKVDKMNNDALNKYITFQAKTKFPKKASMEGVRALFFSKLIGLIKNTSPVALSNAYKEIYKLSNENKDNEVKDIISDQVEKFYFYNDIASITDRHHGQRSVDKFFHIYPVFFVYQVVLRLLEYGHNTEISRFEMNFFVVLSHDHEDLIDCVDRIISYRKYEDKKELEKSLKSSSTMDTRFFNILKNVKYFNFDKQKITLKDELTSDLRSRVVLFEELLTDDQLIRFTDDTKKEYREMLYSDKSLIKYHQDHVL
jgi:HKD family nuclease